MRASYSLDARPGWLTLRGEATSLGAAASPTWVGRRQEHLSCRVATLVDFVPARDGEEAGISVYMNPDHRYEIGVGRANGRRQVFVRQRIGPHVETVTASAPIDGDEPVVLQVEATPEEYAFSFGIAASGTAPDGDHPARQGASRAISRPRWPAASRASTSASTRRATAGPRRHRPTSTGSTTSRGDGWGAARAGMIALQATPL